MKLQKLVCLCGCLLAVPAALSLPTLSLGETPDPQDRRQSLNDAEQVKVALLLPAPEIENWQAARRGAKMAVAEANKNGGFHGRPFQLVVRSLNGPWGSGSKQIVRMAHEENVWAILSWLDGQSVHLAEQIVTKTQIALISTKATDPSLTQINIPWFFSCVPDAMEQAKSLAREIVQHRLLKRLAVLTEKTYDARVAAEVFMKVVASFEQTSPFLLASNDIKTDSGQILRELEQAEIEGIVLFGQSEAAVNFVRFLRKQGMAQPIFGPLSLLNSDSISSEPLAHEELVVIAPGHLMSVRGKVFQKAYFNAYGYQPGAAAAYAYDGIGLIVAAIRLGGLDRKKIRDALKNMHYLQGVTGPIHFDTHGRRQGPFHLIEILKGGPTFIDKLAEIK